MGILERLKRKTPKFWRRLGNALFATFTAVSGFFAYLDDKGYATVFIIVGAIGKLISELAVVDNTKDE